MKYAAFLNKSRTVPADERSKKYPGHGYPEHTVNWVEVKEFESFDEMKNWVERQEKRLGKMSPEYRIVEYKELKIKKTVDIEVEE